MLLLNIISESIFYIHLKIAFYELLYYFYYEIMRFYYEHKFIYVSEFPKHCCEILSICSLTLILFEVSICTDSYFFLLAFLELGFICLKM